MDEILGDRPVTSVSNVLMGAMPGLQVTGTSGQPGAEMSFNIRGVNSINEGAPLVLVDNVEMDINMLDPNDIESISSIERCRIIGYLRCTRCIRSYPSHH